MGGHLRIQNLQQGQISARRAQMAAKNKRKKSLKRGKKLEPTKPLDIVITKYIDKSSPTLAS